MSRNWSDVRIEIANMEYGLDVPILFQQVNTIHNPKNNATDETKSNSKWSKLMK